MDLDGFSITSEEAQSHYWDSFTFCDYKKDELGNRLRKTIPTQDDFEEYRALDKVYFSLIASNDIHNRIKANRFRTLRFEYDWRNQITGEIGHQGMRGADGSIILTEIFNRVGETPLTCRDNYSIIPVSDGKAWGLVYAGSYPIMLTKFEFKTILLERCDKSIFFVKGFNDLWEAFGLDWISSSAGGHYRPKDKVPILMPFLPLESKEIYDIPVCCEEGPGNYWITRNVNNKYGIMTDSQHTDAIYDDINFDYEKHRFICSNKQGIWEVQYHNLRKTKKIR